MHGSNLHLVVTRFFILFFKKTFEKDQKNKQNKLKTYVLDIFVSFLMSFLKNLKLKNLISMLLVFSAFIESKLMLSFFKNQNTKKEKKEKGKKCIHYFSNLIVIMEERE
jgi:dipeptide/tripeptide permease